MLFKVLRVLPIVLYSMTPTLGNLSQESKLEERKVSEVLDHAIPYNLQKYNIQHGAVKTAENNTHKLPLKQG